MKNKTIIFIANWTQGPGLSGGDRIWIELARIWKNSNTINVMGSKESYKLLERNKNIKDIEFKTISEEIKQNNSLSVSKLSTNIIKRTLDSIKFFIKNKELFNSNYVYTTSDFLPDSIVGLLAKLYCKKTHWIAGYYLQAPIPFSKETPYKGIHILKGILYYLLQLPMFFIIKNIADTIYITSEPDKKRFYNKNKINRKIVVVRGGVDTTKIDGMLNKTPIIKDKRIYDCVFQGRLHPQKGVLVLIDIFIEILKTLPNAKLAVIGDGELEIELKEKIKTNHLEKNIELLGFMTDEQKHNIFINSKVVLHPAIYDSGGMAAAEAMAYGIPGVGFDLEALKTYYPKGMLKAKVNDINDFSNLVINLLSNETLYKKVSKEAKELIEERWSWNKRADEIFKETFI